MSAVLGIFGPGADRAPARAMLARMAGRGAAVQDLWTTRDAVIGVARHEWECGPAFAGAARVCVDGGLACATDATLYYRDQLCAVLEASGISIDPLAPPGVLMIAAYRAWGADFVARLEGDFAFVLWDEHSHTVVAGRDFVGRRPLYRATVGPGHRTLLIASAMDAIVGHPQCSREYDPRVLAAAIAQLWAGTDETCYRDVRELHAGTTLVRRAGEAPDIVRHWEPVIGGSTRPFDEAATELRALLERAVEERLAPSGPTAVWLSGGWDSPSVFAAGQSCLRAGRSGPELRPVSLSYPEGDPGREDELITTIAMRWRTSVRWVDVESIPLFVDPSAEAARRDAPYAHTYEHWNRRLASESRALGARVALDGNGGDQLFQLSDLFLADLLRAGRMPSLMREWQAKGGGRRWRTFVRHVMIPALPPGLRAAAEHLRGRRFPALGERIVPDWVRSDFLRAHQVDEWERTHYARRPGHSLWQDEAYSYLVAPAFPRYWAMLSDFARDGGVEVRSPLMDRRVVEFASRRPRAERNSALETKRLLRRAMEGLLPASVLAPRAHRTGVTVAYSDRRLREAFPALLDAMLAEPMVLAELGIVDPQRLRPAWMQYLRTGALHVKIPLFLTLHTELWLRAREGRPARSAASDPSGRAGRGRSGASGHAPLASA